MRSISTFALVAGLCLAFAGSAHAGAFGSPVGFGVCGNLNVDGDEMVDPGTAFTSAESGQCERLCKKGGNLCKTSVNDVGACILRMLAADRSFRRLNCEVVTDNAQDERECKQANNEFIAAVIDGIKEDRADERDDCAAWTETCRTACSAP